MLRRLKKIGGSLGVVINRDILKMMELKENDIIDVSIKKVNQEITEIDYDVRSQSIN